MTKNGCFEWWKRWQFGDLKSPPCLYFYTSSHKQDRVDRRESSNFSNVSNLHGCTKYLIDNKCNGMPFSILTLFWLVSWKQSPMWLSPFAILPLVEIVVDISLGLQARNKCIKLSRLLQKMPLWHHPIPLPILFPWPWIIFLFSHYPSMNDFIKIMLMALIISLISTKGSYGATFPFTSNIGACMATLIHFVLCSTLVLVWKYWCCLGICCICWVYIHAIIIGFLCWYLNFPRKYIVLSTNVNAQ